MTRHEKITTFYFIVTAAAIFLGCRLKVAPEDEGTGRFACDIVVSAMLLTCHICLVCAIINRQAVDDHDVELLLDWRPVLGILRSGKHVVA